MGVFAIVVTLAEQIVETDHSSSDGTGNISGRSTPGGATLESFHQPWSFRVGDGEGGLVGKETGIGSLEEVRADNHLDKQVCPMGVQFGTRDERHILPL